MRAVAAGPFGFSAPQNTWGADTVNKLISNVKRSMHLPLYPHSEHSSPFKTWKHSDAVSSALTPSSRSLSPAHRRRTQSTSEVFASPFDNIRQHEVLRGAEMASFPRSNFENYEANRKQNLMINTYPDQPKAQPPVNMFSGVLAQPSSFFSGLMQSKYLMLWCFVKLQIHESCSIFCLIFDRMSFSPSVIIVLFFLHHSWLRFSSLILQDYFNWCACVAAMALTQDFIRLLWHKFLNRKIARFLAVKL